uniref:Uncharacterized protein n=1 Tax=Trypanosoma vivax (strain Y486) TaxID=1055687 RepID=G0U535_TRYVY|nr:hypothetical protein, unlikely [Trypanosoma vivax Y486]
MRALGRRGNKKTKIEPQGVGRRRGSGAVVMCGVLDRVQRACFCCVVFPATFTQLPSLFGAFFLSDPLLFPLVPPRPSTYRLTSRPATASRRLCDGRNNKMCRMRQKSQK